MGGGTSRFEETDWENATGKLTRNDETIDGRKPTAKYGVYFLTKHGLNQRDYDITDEHANLLYTSKGIEGTLACFDLLGRRMDDYKIRVLVDLSRRYWIIYSFGVPAYSGQFADMKETSTLRQSRGESSYCLYKKACITVSWSRFYAIVNRYGPPSQDCLEEAPQQGRLGSQIPTEKEQHNERVPLLGSNHTDSFGMDGMDSIHSLLGNDDDKEQSAQVSVSDNASLAKSTEYGLASSEHSTAANSEAETQSAQQSSVENDPESGAERQISYGVEETKEDGSTSSTSNQDHDHDQPSSINSEIDAKQENAATTASFQVCDKDGRVVATEQPDEQNITEGTLDRLAKKAHIPRASLRQWKEWAKRSMGKGSFNTRNPLEGFLLLDQPLLKCEEINSFMGQHQTMLLSKEEAELLKKEELEACAERGTSAHHPDEAVRDRQAAPPSAEFVGHTAASNVSSPFSAEGRTAMNRSQSFPRIRRFAKWVSQKTMVIAPTEEEQPDPDAHEKPTETDMSVKVPLLDTVEVKSKGTASRPQEEEVVFQMEPDGDTNAVVGAATEETLSEDEATIAPPRGSEFLSSQNKETIGSLTQTTTTTTTEERVQINGDDDGRVNGHRFKSVDADVEKVAKPAEPANSQKEPLVGYWTWDNTMKVHKMKMHVAGGSDLALHVVLAIVTNQLRLERNVVLSTV